jgi:hypothetical protein
MKISLRLPAAVLLLLCGAGVAFGQSYVAFDDEWRRIVEGLKFSLGPLKIDPGFSLRNLGYDSNVYYGNQDVGDYTGTVSPSVTAYLPFRRSLILYVRENPEYNFYLHEKALRTFTNSYAAGLKYLLLYRFVLTGAYQYSEYQRQISAEIGTPVRDISRTVSAGLFYETARKTSIGISVQSTKFAYQDIMTPEGEIALARTLNREEKSAAAEFNYQVFSDSQFFIRGGATDYAFDNPLEAERNSTSYQGYAGLRFPLLGRLRGTISIGYKRLVPHVKDLSTFGSLVGNTEVEARFGWFSLRALYQRDLVFSYYEDALAFVGNRYAGGLSVYPASFLRLDYGYEIDESDYPDVWNSTALLTPVTHRQERQEFQTAGIIIRLWRTTGFGITFNKSIWTSSFQGFDRKRNYIAAYVTQAF